MKKFVASLSLIFFSLTLFSQTANSQITPYDDNAYVLVGDQPLYNLMDPSWQGITWTTTSDDNGTAINNFTFEWSRWEQTFNSGWQSSNGCLSFTGICYSYTPSENGYLENTLYPLWTDLIAVNGDAKMAYYGDQDKMIFGWYNVQEYYNTQTSNSFEVILYADDSYEYRYGPLDIRNHNVYIGEEGNSQQSGGKTLNTYLWYNRYASGAPATLDEYIASLNVQLEGSALYIGGNVYTAAETEVPPNYSDNVTQTDPCNTDPQSSPNCPGYVEPYNQVDDLTNVFTSNDLVFGDSPLDFVDLGINDVDYGIATDEFDTTASFDFGENSVDYGESGIDYGILDTSNTEENIFVDTSSDVTDTAPIDTTTTEEIFVSDAGSEELFDENLGYTDANLYDSSTGVSDEIIMADVLDTEVDLLPVAEDSVTETSATTVAVAEREETEPTVVARETTTENERGRVEIQKALDILSSLEATKDNPAFSVPGMPGSTDPVNIALSTINAEKELIQDLIITDELLSEAEEVGPNEEGEVSLEEMLAVDSSNDASDGSSSSQEFTDSNDGSSGSEMIASSDSEEVSSSNSNQQTINEENSQMIVQSGSDSISDGSVFNESDEVALIEAETIVSLDSSSQQSVQSQDTTVTSDSTIVADVSTEIVEDYSQSESSTNSELVNELLAENLNSTTTDSNMNSQFDQLLATGATTIGQVVSGEQPDYTKFDVKPLPQEEQTTVAKAEAQLESFTQQDVKNNLDSYTAELQESGGFDSNAQTLTMLLMARVQGYNYGSVTLSDRPTFYAPKSVYTTNAIKDNNNNLRLLLTDDRHKQLVDLQY